jgi:hypothetical protein
VARACARVWQKIRLSGLHLPLSSVGAKKSFNGITNFLPEKCATRRVGAISRDSAHPADAGLGPPGNPHTKFSFKSWSPAMPKFPKDLPGTSCSNAYQIPNATFYMKDFVSCCELIHEQTAHSQAVITTESNHEKTRSVAFAHWLAVVPS